MSFLNGIFGGGQKAALSAEVANLKQQLAQTAQAAETAEQARQRAEAEAAQTKSEVEKTKAELDAEKARVPAITMYTLLSIASHESYVLQEVYDEYVEAGTTIRQFLEKECRGKDLSNITKISITNSDGTQEEADLDAPLPKIAPKTLVGTQRGGEFS